MIPIKKPEEIEVMRKGGSILSRVLKILCNKVEPGVKLIELDRLAERLILSYGAKPSFKMVKRYRWSICACVNDVVVHGIPTERVLKKGDIIGIDCGVYYKGFHTDAAWTVRVNDSKSSKQQDEIDRFLSVGSKALCDAIAQVKIGNYIYDISKAIQDMVEEAGFSMVQTLVGHGIGKKLHEEPEIPGIVRKKRLETPRISNGMTFAIEVIYNMGGSNIIYQGDDRWTIVTEDGKISGLFEATVAVVSHGCFVLTASDAVLTHLTDSG